jgi:hypothetical protein
VRPLLRRRLRGLLAVLCASVLQQVRGILCQRVSQRDSRQDRQKMNSGTHQTAAVILNVDLRQDRRKKVLTGPPSNSNKNNCLFPARLLINAQWHIKKSSKANSK